MNIVTCLNTVDILKITSYPLKDLKKILVNNAGVKKIAQKWRKGYQSSDFINTHYDR